VGVNVFTPTLWFLAAMRKSVGEKSMGKLSAVVVRTALANPGTYQDGEGTVRSQLSQVYAKAGVKNQSMLIAQFIDELVDPLLPAV